MTTFFTAAEIYSIHAQIFFNEVTAVYKKLIVFTWFQTMQYHIKVIIALLCVRDYSHYAPVIVGY